MKSSDVFSKRERRVYDAIVSSGREFSSEEVSDIIWPPHRPKPFRHIQMAQEAMRLICARSLALDIYIENLGGRGRGKKAIYRARERISLKPLPPGVDWHPNGDDFE